MDGPGVSPLTDSDRDWLVDRLRGAADLITSYNGDDSPPTLDDLDDCLERWARDSAESRPTPDHAVQALGVAFGAHLAEICDLDWAVVNDDFGRDIVLVGQPGDIIVAPIAATAKRVDAGTFRFFAAFANEMAPRIAQVRADGA